MKAIKLIVLLAVSTFIFNACTKEVAGPTGPNGVQGAQGPSASYFVTIDSLEPSQWTLNSAHTEYSATITPVSALTNPNYSIVEVYYATSFNAQSTWYELPIASTLSASGAFDFSYTLYTVFIQYASTTAPGQQLYFKVVVINQP